MLTWTDPEAVNRLIESLKSDKISIVCTDTIPGFIANLSQKNHYSLNKLKGDRGDKPYLVMIDTPSKISYFVDKSSITPEMQSILKHCWPGPLTIVFKLKPKHPDLGFMATNTVAIRCPKHDFLQQVLSHFNGLFSTSANISGQPAPIHIENIPLEIQQQVEYIIHYENFKNKSENKPSTILDLSKPDTPKILRDGAYPLKKLEEIYGKKFFK